MKHLAMATSGTCKTVVLLMFLMLVAPAFRGAAKVAGPLRYDFYDSSCPKAEAVIRKTVEEIIASDPGMAAKFLKFFFLDCFTSGCDASLLVDDGSEHAERNDLRTREYRLIDKFVDAVDKIKVAVEAICPGIVSCADIIALAARDSVSVSGSFTFAIPTGRRDGLTTSVVYDFYTDSRIFPNPYLKLERLIYFFSLIGLDVDDFVVLSGAHSMGTAHCFSFDSRLYPSVDGDMNATYAEGLKKVCVELTDSASGESGPVVNNNQLSDDPNVLSNQYYSNVLTGQVLLKSDQALMSRNDTAAKVTFYAANPLAWKVRFAAALVKMGNSQVLTGTQGEIRKVCSAKNN